ncbi:MAG: conserved rane protein of unknown function [Myxococcales bacterium]|nr:conserved rane protein of unknown function [Myxococcales bacterium]
MTDEVPPEIAAVEPAPAEVPTLAPGMADAKPSGPRTPDLWDQTADWLGKHGALPMLALITVIIGVVHSGVFRGETSGDDLTFHFAESARLADCLRALDFDFWNPSANAGYASIYYYQAIPQLASALPTAIFGHHLFWFELSVWLPLVLAPAAAYRGMRLLGCTPWQSVLAAFVIAFMNGESRWGSGNAGTFQVGLYTQTWALAALPLALGHAARWITEKRGLAPAVAWGAFVGLCHPFAVVALGVGLVVSLIAKLLPVQPLRRVSIVGGLLVIAGVAIILILPRSWLLPDTLPTLFDIPLLVWLVGVPLCLVGVLLSTMVPFVRPVFLGRVLIIIGVVVMMVLPNEWVLANVSPLIRWLVGGAIVIAGFAVPFFLPRDERWSLPSRQDGIDELLRIVVLGALMVIAWMPIWLPLLTDYEGFGGFPHRVNDEVGPGFFGLSSWYAKGAILDWATSPRPAVFTLLLPAILLFVRAKFLRWLWPPALFYALLLGLGPHLGRTQDDLLPMVRFLGAMQTVLALGLGAGVVILGAKLWHVPIDNWLRRPPPPGDVSPAQFWMRTALAAIAAALVVFVVVTGSKALNSRVHVLDDYPASHRDEMMTINEILARQPPGRKQVAAGAENHWWNLLSYAYERVPALLQMGGGGLQASPNYDFLWSNRDYLKNAWLYDAPYIVFQRSLGSKIPLGETVSRTENYEIRRLTTEGLVSPVQIVGVLPAARTDRKKAALEWLKSDAPMKDQVLAYAGSGAAGDPPSGKLLSAWHQDSPGDDADIVAEVEAQKPSTFVIRESWHPRWHAFVDGDEVPIRRVTPDFPAVDVPAGKHTIELRFQRPLWLLLSWLMWPGAAAGAWLYFRRRRNTNLPVARVVEQ